MIKYLRNFGRLECCASSVDMDFLHIVCFLKIKKNVIIANTRLPLSLVYPISNRLCDDSHFIRGTYNYVDKNNWLARHFRRRFLRTCAFCYYFPGYYVMHSSTMLKASQIMALNIFNDWTKLYFLPYCSTCQFSISADIWSANCLLY